MNLTAYQGHNIVFVVGSPRSGTTWVQRLLACHPLVRTGQESDLFDLYVGQQLRTWRRELRPDPGGRGVVGLACYLREEEFLAILREYMLGLLEPMVGSLGPGEIFVEKTPSHALFIPEIAELLPEARFIHVLRDGRDVAASLLAASRSWGRQWAPHDARRAARMWVEHVEAARRAGVMLQPVRFHEVRYEDLCSHPLQILKGLSDFLGLDWDEAGIREAVNRNRAELVRAGGGTAIPVGGQVATNGTVVVTEPRDFVRKARVGSWKEDLSLGAKIIIWLVARRTLLQAGYPWRFPW